MPDAQAGVLITRPKPGAGETAVRVAALGFRPIVAPLLEIRPNHVELPPSARVQGIVVASGNAVPALPASHHHLPVFAVGDATADRARKAGFTDVTSAGGDAEALGALVARACHRQAGPLLLAVGRGQSSKLAADLRSHGFAVIRRVVYAAVPVASLPLQAHEAFATGQLAAAMFFSAETARHCVDLLRATQLHESVGSVEALAIGRPAAVALEALPWRRVRVAIRPNQDAMLALLR